MNESKPYFDNRELSWLKFNRRVLEEAEDETVPLFERLRFVAIFCSNLDEFFMVRVGSLHDQTLLQEEKIDNKTNLTPREQLALIAKRTAEQLPKRDMAYSDIMKAFADRGIVEIDLSDEDNLNEIEKYYIDNYFSREVFPLLSPSVIDKKHPLPFLKNKEIYFGAVLKRKNPEKHSMVIGILPATSDGIFPRVVFLPCESGIRFVRIENLIMHFADRIFPGYEVTQKNIFRITRNADLEAEEALLDHDLDFRDVMEELVKKRKKLAPVRIEFFEKCDDAEIDFVTEKLSLELGRDFVFVQASPLDMSYVNDLEDRVKAMSGTEDMFYTPLNPQFPAMINKNEPMMKQIKEKDLFLTYPYESIKPFITLLEQAASDPSVVSIKITLYRVARGSQIVNALITAAENGKDVLALVELRARFDEENNIGWSKCLEEAGVKIIYGLDGMKVHSKLLLITCRTGISVQYFTQVGTGNYNERTSKLYTDLTLMTADQEIGTDASMVFNALSMGTTVESSTALWVAPNCLKSRVVALIDNEISYGEQGYIGLKLNSLTDKDIIEKLVQASCKGVKIQLLIRGICCLIAGIPGYTENISVTSIVGRFLEHSRVYIFGRNERQRVYISSADFMTRNTERRVEVAAPIRDESIKNRIVNDFNTMLMDNVKTRIQQPDGIYRKKDVSKDIVGKRLDVQTLFYEQAYERAPKEVSVENGGKNTVLQRIKNLFKKKK